MGSIVASCVDQHLHRRMVVDGFSVSELPVVAIAPGIHRVSVLVLLHDADSMVPSAADVYDTFALQANHHVRGLRVIEMAVSALAFVEMGAASSPSENLAFLCS